MTSAAAKGVIRRCLACGKRLSSRAKQRHYCDDACRKWAARARQTGVHDPSPTASEFAPKNPDKSVGCSRLSADRGSGIHGPARVIAVEVFDRHAWSPAGAAVQVARVRYRARSGDGA